MVAQSNKFNTGNLRTSGKNLKFREYGTLEEGIADHQRLLKDYQNKHGLTTVREIISRWAPPSENDTENYIKFMSKKLGVKPDEKIDLNDSETLGKFAYYQSQMEKGVDKTPATVEDMVRVAESSKGADMIPGSSRTLTEEEKKKLEEKGALAEGANSRVAGGNTTIPTQGQQGQQGVSSFSEDAKAAVNAVKKPFESWFGPSKPEDQPPTQAQIEAVYGKGIDQGEGPSVYQRGKMALSDWATQEKPISDADFGAMADAQTPEAEQAAVNNADTGPGAGDYMSMLATVMQSVKKPEQRGSAPQAYRANIQVQGNPFENKLLTQSFNQMYNQPMNRQRKYL